MSNDQATMKISGFTLVRDAVRLDFPILEAIQSILPLCEEVIVNVGRSDDGTLDLVRSLDDPRVRILEAEWDLARGPALLREETERAMRACRHAWGMCIQADEVLHERGVEKLRAALAAVVREPGVEGLLVEYHHFVGDPFTEAMNRRWYRHEVRLVRTDPAWGIEPWADAQGFRVRRPDGRVRKIRARLTGAEMFHYGHTRSAIALRQRVEMDRHLYPGRAARAADEPLFEWFPGLRPFRGTHPAVAAAWVAAHAEDPGRKIAHPRFRWRHIRFHLSDLVERLTGHRPFTFRNYTLV